MVEFLVDKED